MKKFALLLLVSTTTACISRPSAPISARPAVADLEERARFANLSLAYEAADVFACNDEGVCEKKPGATIKYKDMTEAELTSFVDAGVTLSDLYCDRFFRAVNQASRKRQFARGATNDVGYGARTS